VYKFQSVTSFSFSANYVEIPLEELWMPYLGQKINSPLCWSLPLNCSDNEVYFEVKYLQLQSKRKLFWLWDVTEASLCKIWVFTAVWKKTWGLLRCYAVLTGKWLPRFQGSLFRLQGQAVFQLLYHDDGCTTLIWNVGNFLPANTALFQRNHQGTFFSHDVSL
jgi:hypothetical protein